MKIGQYCQRQRCKHVELEQFWQAFASRGLVSDSWAFLLLLLSSSAKYGAAWLDKDEKTKSTLLRDCWSATKLRRCLDIDLSLISVSKITPQSASALTTDIISVTSTHWLYFTLFSCFLVAQCVIQSGHNVCVVFRYQRPYWRLMMEIKICPNLLAGYCGLLSKIQVSFTWKLRTGLSTAVLPS